jgi:hypothetical protein
MTLLLKTTGWWVWSGETEDGWFSPSGRGFNFGIGSEYWEFDIGSGYGGANSRYDADIARGYAVRSRMMLSNFSEK